VEAWERLLARTAVPPSACLALAVLSADDAAERLVLDWSARRVTRRSTRRCSDRQRYA
jgi:hypothetical protein